MPKVEIRQRLAVVGMLKFARRPDHIDERQLGCRHAVWMRHVVIRKLEATSGDDVYDFELPVAKLDGAPATEKNTLQVRVSQSARAGAGPA